MTFVLLNITNMKFDLSVFPLIGRQVLNLEIYKKRQVIDSFVYGCSHGIRSPLKSMEGLVNLLKEYQTVAADRETYLLLLKQSVAQMQSILKNLQQLNANSQRPLKIRQVDVGRLLDIVLEKNKNLINERAIEVSRFINQRGALYSDAERIETILSILVSNAIHYSDANKTKKKLSIYITSGLSSCSIQVHDNGIGIPESAQQHVFNLFYRASEQSTGAGIALHLAKQVTAKLNGDLSLTSHLNQGSVFSLWIPNLGQ